MSVQVLEDTERFQLKWLYTVCIIQMRSRNIPSNNLPDRRPKLEKQQEMNELNEFTH